MNVTGPNKRDRGVLAAHSVSTIGNVDPTVRADQACMLRAAAADSAPRRLTIIGLGYVGIVSASCFAKPHAQTKALMSRVDAIMRT